MPTISNRRAIGLVFVAILLAGCTTTDVIKVDNDPPIRQLADEKQVEETPLEGELVLKRFASDPQGRFTVSISPLDGSERNRAFTIAEQNYARMCGHQPFGTSGGAEPGVGKIGSRAPYYDLEQRAHFIYMQCSVTQPAG